MLSWAISQDFFELLAEQGYGMGRDSDFALMAGFFHGWQIVSDHGTPLPHIVCHSVLA